MNDTAQGQDDRPIDDILEACDLLGERLEAYTAQLEAEKPRADASGDPTYTYRVDRGITWTKALLDLLDDDVLERVGNLRHNHTQLGWARQGKMV